MPLLRGRRGRSCGRVAGPGSAPAHFIFIGVLAIFGLIFACLFCYFTHQGVKQSSEGFGVAAAGSFLASVGCIGGMAGYWCNYLYPLLR